MSPPGKKFGHPWLNRCSINDLSHLRCGFLLLFWWSNTCRLLLWLILTMPCQFRWPPSYYSPTILGPVRCELFKASFINYPSFKRLHTFITDLSAAFLGLQDAVCLLMFSNKPSRLVRRIPNGLTSLEFLGKPLECEWSGTGQVRKLETKTGEGILEARRKEF